MSQSNRAGLTDSWNESLSTSITDSHHLYHLCEDVVLDIGELEKNLEKNTASCSHNRIQHWKLIRSKSRYVFEKKALLDRCWFSLRNWINDINALDNGNNYKHAAGVYRGSHNTTALHLICKLPNPPAEVLRSIVGLAPEVVAWPDSDGWLPIHHASVKISLFGTISTSIEVLELLVGHHLHAKEVQDKKGRTPLHLVFCRSDIQQSRDGIVAGTGERKSGDHGINIPNSCNHNDHNLDDEEDQRNDADQSINAPLDLDPRKENYLVEMVELLSDSRAPQLVDDRGMIPLHYASAYGTSTDIFSALFKAFPEGVNIKENQGRTSLHFVMVNAHNDTSPSLLKFLVTTIADDTRTTQQHSSGDNMCNNSNSTGYTDSSSFFDSDTGDTPLIRTDSTSRSEPSSIINHTDDEENLPIHFLSKISLQISGERVEERSNVLSCLEIYLNAEPRSSASFLSALQCSPEWIRQHAVKNGWVQKNLNYIIAKRFPTSILLLDIYMYIMIIICLQFVAEDHINTHFAARDINERQLSDDNKGNNQIPIHLIIVGGTYFLLREILQMFSLVSLGSFHSYFFGYENWLDITVIVLIFVTSATTLNNDLIEDEFHFRTLMAITMAALWGAMISFLKSTVVGFAVFVETMAFVTRCLLFFMLALSVILISFAEMFLFIYKDSAVCHKMCGDMASFPHCTFGKSLLKVYTMMLGEVGEINRYQASTIAQVLYVLFAFLVVLLLSNVLIAIVTDSYGVIRNERAEIIFWMNRLEFIAEIDAIASIPEKLIRKAPFLKIKFQTDARNTNETSLDNIAIQGPQSKKGNSYSRPIWTALFDILSDEFDRNGLIDVFIISFLRFFIIVVIIPVWILAGIATVGILWPPQVREFLWGQKRISISKSRLRNQLITDMAQLTSEMVNLKQDFKDNLDSDEKEIQALKIEVKKISNDILAELVQVREIMTTMLELSRNK